MTATDATALTTLHREEGAFGATGGEIPELATSMKEALRRIAIASSAEALKECLGGPPAAFCRAAAAGALEELMGTPMVLRGVSAAVSRSVCLFKAGLLGMGVAGLSNNRDESHANQAHSSVYVRLGETPPNRFKQESYLSQIG